jgi:hypothetical protein
MMTRWLALVAAVWAAAYVGVYLVLVHDQENGPAWWYVGLVALSILPLIAAAGGRSSRPALVGSVVTMAVATLLGLLSIGLLLLPALICALVAAVAMKPTATDAGPLPTS